MTVSNITQLRQFKELGKIAYNDGKKAFDRPQGMTNTQHAFWMLGWEEQRDNQVKMPTYEELVEFAQWSRQFQPNAIKIMRKHGLKIDNLEDQMQKLAFTFYTDLCEIEQKARRLFEEDP